MASAALDYKKEFWDLYHPKAAPRLIDVPAILFLAVDGKGNPNEEGGEYSRAMELLYALSYSIKMSKMGPEKPEGYFEYVIPPLEGLWWLEGDRPFAFSEKDKFCWTSMIRQPEFVTPGMLDSAKAAVRKKKPELDVSRAKFFTYREGLCVQVMHLGPYDGEPATMARLQEFLRANGYRDAVSDRLPDGTVLRHHEIYLGDPRKTEPSRLKTVLRHPVKK
ncbi:GyrI-like domain-containing protein [Papillibacter cinnamivorans]|uniref:GyrI-like small molecule binding domain-containing protein n=1 Tax=Papillibacter cinnamivorans DSM 12816 TaxID=1122930 RepID=A0A1W2CAY3_9FIRM|nr:GyrI-like domain-containing protein [Papillibacter cinnamivorans]SMC81838.1 hypothetical protein SAMN02745168_2648 [Papillibacter cinnamivorans DSM 12816]